MAEILRLNFETKEMRILPRRRSGPDSPREVIPHSRVRVLRTDEQGFVIVEAKLLPGEGVCWECGSVANDPDSTLERCPVCHGFFND
jgi:hypothetical protein